MTAAPEHSTASEQPPAKKRRQPERPRTPINTSLRLLAIKDICDLTGMSEKTIKALRDKGEFPQPFSTSSDSGRETLRWTLGQYEGWVRDRVKKAGQQVA